MAVYPSVYRARVTQIRGRRVQALVPQVFGEAPIVIEQFIGVVPTRPRMAWVFFQGGNPEFPVLATGGSYNISIIEGGGGGEDIDVIRQRNYQWTANNTDETDPGRGKAKANNTNPLLATEVYVSLYDQSGQAAVTALDLKAGDQIAMYQAGDLSKGVRYTLMSDIVNHDFEWLSAEVTVEEDLGFAPKNNESIVIASYATIPGGGGGGGGGVNEVWVGPSTPTDGTSELWYDTDEPADGAILYWNTAWGTIGKGVFNTVIAGTYISCAAGVQTTVATLTCNTVAGRRYAVRMFCNAMTGGTGYMNLYVDGVAKSDGPWSYAGGNYNHFQGGWSLLENLSTGPHTFMATFTNNTGSAMNLYFDGGHFLLDDLGPVTRASVEPPAQVPPSTVASGNALGIVAILSPINGVPLTITSAGTMLTTPLNFTMQLGRRYRFVANLRGVLAGGSSFYLNWVNGTDGPNILPGYLSNPSGELYQAPVGKNDWSGYGGGTYMWVVDGDGVNRNYAMRAFATATNGTNPQMYHDGAMYRYYIEDIGPNSSPALPVEATPAAWVNINTFANGWRDGGGVNAWQYASYRKIGDMVQVRGLVYAPASAATGVVAWTMPPGFRPPMQLAYGLTGLQSSPTNTVQVPEIQFYPNGNVMFNHIAVNSHAHLGTLMYSVTP